MNAAYLGWDIGGANLKHSLLGRDGAGRDTFLSGSLQFPLWNRPEKLAEQLRRILNSQLKVAEQLKPTPHELHLAITMTGELADCYESRRLGVAHIIECVQSACAKQPRLGTTAYYQVTGEFVDAHRALTDFPKTAAANWHALGTFVAASLHIHRGLLVDIGSTTTDLIALAKGQVKSNSLSDLDRLMAGELIYTGVRRSPVCGVLNHVQLRETQPGLANELFATTGDAWMLLGKLPEAVERQDTADGRPWARQQSARRLARCLCSDSDELATNELMAVAHQIAIAQTRAVTAGIQRQIKALDRSDSTSDPDALTVVTAGEGEFLARLALEQLESKQLLPKMQSVSLTGKWGAANSASAAACATAWLLRETARQLSSTGLDL